MLESHTGSEKEERGDSLPSPIKARLRSAFIVTAHIPLARTQVTWTQLAARGAGKCSFILSTYVLKPRDSRFEEK